MTSGRGSSIHPEPEKAPRSENPWSDRVREADAEAEAQWAIIGLTKNLDAMARVALIAIAAELRAQRIARRPGAGR